MTTLHHVHTPLHTHIYALTNTTHSLTHVHAHSLTHSHARTHARPRSHVRNPEPNPDAADAPPKPPRRIVGTPQYFPPERYLQTRGEIHVVDGMAADVFSLAILMCAFETRGGW